ncbi:MAG: tRNA (adenosine(37)-N6)-threonylcarbamoyltransferase complex transferase subunit TsaD [Parcubacteria group bacterium]|nr:tRNA (adenosine(37)-N6)-threonylcarbamoyltransferase complex transferase subunit TsaD [Parcubacteria group bacterium]
MIILGIETSCDETSIAILEAKKEKAYFFIKPIASVVSSQIKIHAPYGGVVPMLASREHTKNLPLVFRKVVQDSFDVKKIKQKIDLIAVTSGPGLMPALLTGVNFAKTLAWSWRKPIIGVNHLEGHLLSVFLPEKNKISLLPFQELQKIFPAIALIVSGGHTQLIYVKNIGHYQIIGETLDDAAGECFDKGARILGLGYPGGPAIAKEAEKYRIQNTEYRIQKLPRPMIDSKNYDFSFSGLKTALLYAWQKTNKKERKRLMSQFAFELEESITDVLVHKTLQAANDFKVKSIILGGGVTANQKLRLKMQETIAQQKNPFNFYFPLLQYTTDNAMMICLEAFFNISNKKLNYKNLNWEKINADANWRL